MSVRDPAKGSSGRRDPFLHPGTVLELVLFGELRLGCIYSGRDSSPRSFIPGGKLRQRKPQSCFWRRSPSLPAFGCIPTQLDLCPNWFPLQPSMEMLLNVLVILTTEETATC